MRPFRGLPIRSALMPMLLWGSGAVHGAEPLPPSLQLILEPQQRAAPAAFPAARSPSDLADLEKRLVGARRELARTVDAPEGSQPVGVPEADLVERISLLEQLVRNLERERDARRALPAAEGERAAAEARARNWAGFSTPPPYSVLLVDGLRSDLLAATDRVKATKAKIALLGVEFDRSQRALQSAEAQLRVAQERLDGARNAPDVVRIVWQRDLAQLRSRAAAAAVSSRDAEIQKAKAERGQYEAELLLFERQLAAVRKSVSFTQADLDQVLARIERKRVAAEEQVRETEAQTLEARQALAKAEQALEQADAEPAGPGAASVERTRRVTALASAAALARAKAENTSLAFDLAKLELDAASNDRIAWQQRWDLSNSKDASKLRAAYEFLDDAMVRLKPWHEFVTRELAVVTTQIGDQERRVVAAASQDDAAPAQAMLATLEQRADLYRKAQALIETYLRTLALWERDYAEQRGARPPGVVMRDVYAQIAAAVQAVWNFELFTAEDTLEVDGRKITATRSVTVGKSIGAVLVLLLGWLASSWLLRRAQRTMEARFKLAPNVANILRRWAQFFVLAVLFVLSLDLVKIPLTVFAFLGGALAIGFGFGAQNLLKNFMSGLMLLMERPMRVGDIVHIGDILGTVTNISIRASTVRSADGIETHIPNSTFLEHNVTNWTYSNARVRKEFRVGVAYGSPTRVVADTLLSVAERHGQVLKDPAPRVLFHDFGDNALVFALQYWIDYAAGADSLLIASDLRFMTEKALADAGIAIPFPQRDVHLDTPVRVEVVAGARSATG